MAFRINVCDADKGGNIQPFLVEEGYNVGSFFRDHKPGKSLSNYRVVVNEQPAQSHTVLSADCRLTISPSKFAGAAGSKKTIQAKARLDVVRSLFCKAQSECINVGDQLLLNTVQGLGVLDKPTGQQVDECLGLLDGSIELHRRYQNLVKQERTAVAGEDAEESEVDEVDDTKARATQPTDAMRGLLRTRVWLSAASVLLHNQDRPVANTDQVPVPDRGMGGGGERPAPRQRD